MDVFIYLDIRLELHFSVITVFIYCPSSFGEFVPGSFIYLLCKHWSCDQILLIPNLQPFTLVICDHSRWFTNWSHDFTDMSLNMTQGLSYVDKHKTITNLVGTHVLMPSYRISILMTFYKK